MMKALALLLMLFAAFPAQAEINPQDDPIHVPEAMDMCAHGPQTSCDLVFRTLATLFHAGHAAKLLPPGKCFDLSGEIPAWESAIRQSFYAYAERTPSAELRTMDVFTAAVNAVSADYPCTGKTDD